ncbi:MAG: hypothetical protein K8R54_05605 [Bacteroidales bacterium]|nr:hypothetical protein [Bacteroidales bacterium]
MNKTRLILTMLIAVMISFTACKKDEPNVAPDKPSNPTPAHEAVDIEISLPFISWTCSDADADVISYGVYFGTSEDPDFKETVVGDKSYNLAGLEVNTKYYWKIIANDGNEHETASDVWNFTTGDGGAGNTGTITEIMTKGFLNTTSEGGGVDRGIDITINNSGTPYIALNKEDVSVPDSKASTEVWSYSGSSWNLFGSSRVEITDDEAPTPGIIIANDDKVYVSYEYYNDDNNPRFGNQVISFSTGTNWEILGGTHTTAHGMVMNGTNPLKGVSEFAFKQDGTLLISLVDYGDGYVYYFNEASDKWESYSGYTVDSQSFWAGGIDINTVGNKPYVCIRTGSGDGKIGVLYGSETNGQNGQWEWLGSYASGSHNASFQYEEVGEAPLAISSTGYIYTAYNATVDGDHTVFVKGIANTGSSWTTLFSQLYINKPNQVEVIISNGILYLVCANYDGGIEIHKYNSETNTWNIEGSTSKIDTYYNIELTAGINGEFFIAYECTYDYAGQVGVYKYVPPVE